MTSQMNKLKLLILTFIISYSTLFSYEIKGIIRNYPDKKIEIISTYGEKENLQDSIYTNAIGEFHYKFSNNITTGVKYLKFNNSKIIEFIFDDNNIELYSVYGSLKDSLRFQNSETNTDYYIYKKKKDNFINKFELLQPLIFEYPSDNNFYWKIKNEYLRIQKNFEDFCNKIINKNPNGFLSKYITTDRPIIIQPMDSYKELLNYLKNHYFDNAQFNDDIILNSRVLPDRIITYLSLYMNRKKKKEALEEDYKKAVDYLLSLPIENKEVYNYILEYLQEGFEKYHFDKVLEHISLNYHYRQSCENEERRILLQQRLNKIGELAIGKPAPKIDIKDINGKEINLSDINSEYTLVIFWASWCLHCKELIPKIYENFHNIKKEKLRIIAISIDTDYKSYLKYLNKYNFDWININLPKAWNAKLCNEYNIYATPTMYLLDKNKKIISKPVSLSEIKELH